MKNYRLILFLSFFTCFSMMAETYYVNSSFGNNRNSGISEAKPWKDLTRVNKQKFEPGDIILFASGTSYFGTLEPKGSGSAESPILIDKYGSGPKPAIHGTGWKDHTLLLYNVEYWEIRNLEITNQGPERKARRRGVIIRAVDFGDCHHIVLEGLEIHHVNGLLEKKKGGGSGILWENKGKRVKTRFIDLQILNNYIHHCDRNAINSKGNIQRTAWHPSLGVVIRGNLIENVPGDGIVPLGCDGALIEYNVIRKGLDVMSVGDAAAGIWPWSSDNTLIQFNEVSDHRAKWDGQAYDADFNCIGTTFQYNYSYDNWGGFMLICNNGNKLGEPNNIGTKDTKIHYNLSINDGLRPYKAHNKRFFSPIFHITGPVENTDIHHNIIIMPKKPVDDIENTLIEFGDWGGTFPIDTQFSNNIIRSQEPSGILKRDQASGLIEQGNDVQSDFDYEEKNPLKVLGQLKEHPMFKNNSDFELLHKFIKHRMTHPDPRFAGR
ncbi:right-handed parallel beta-helix repeat-containing protein [Lutimonas saemankumensis]|uniref:right-handed parallel beta-helix repeat-containing protein n=1 Tax=Lutimonas saemankumensis TaxID=483016 RepID=UPI001CD2BDB5|nr:right-handed parallel beta-helix repeat-containing protein [Lutimonas saemankumensis]MCA0932481.1 right-handed parallel beta-helix repeat-containing protein [Lutimonas saemankumensis]